MFCPFYIRTVVLRYFLPPNVVPEANLYSYLSKSIEENVYTDIQTSQTLTFLMFA